MSEQIGDLTNSEKRFSMAVARLYLKQHPKDPPPIRPWSNGTGASQSPTAPHCHKKNAGPFSCWGSAGL